MRNNDPTFTPPSLAQHFEAPDDFLGCFGWLCGFSADVGFLDDAVERFVRQTELQRAYEGRIVMALMLDPSNPQITPKDVPGVLHLPINKGAQPFKLLHAKVAILGFRHTSDANQWRIRLLVSTGNWTRETLQDSLDLVWRADLSDQDLKGRDESVAQACADVTAAWRMLDWLRGYFDTRVLHATRPDRLESDSLAASRRLEAWIDEVGNVGKRLMPRFFDNREASFLAKLPTLVTQHGASSARNYLAMGSGFYESPDGKESIPSVLNRIVDSLKTAQLLTKKPEVDVFVNPKACQAVAHCVPAFNHAGWKVRDAGEPAYFKAAPRSLHAKFIFSATERNNSDFCNSAWLYLGSGNLTGPGFANQMASQSGNLEAGVVFAPESLRWLPAKDEPSESVVTNVLPLQWEEDFGELPRALATGEDMPEPETRYTAPPVAYLLWVIEGDAGWLRPSEDVQASFDVLDGSGQTCRREGAKGFSWSDTRPREVVIRWRSGEREWQARIAVVDEFGRIAATALPRIDIEEAWGQLANFPTPPDEEQLLSDGDCDSPGVTVEQGAAGYGAASYPVRQMMQLVENIAAKQTSVCRTDWATWCTRLEQCLIQAAGSQVLEEFSKLRLNPISPLWHAPFRPDFALSTATIEGRRFEESLKRVEAAWNVAALSDIGERA